MTIRPLAFVAVTLVSASTFAQDQAPNWLVDTLYASGKINVVIAVFGVILVGLLIWMFAQDRRIKRLEEKN